MMRAILTYHSVDTTGSPISVSPDEFQAHVRWLASDAVQVVPLGDLAQTPETTDAVSLTFDDALMTAIKYAAPVLRENGLPATFFIPTAHVGKDNRWGGREDPGIPVLAIADWNTLGHLAEDGFELAAHTRTHPKLPMCDDAQLMDELEGADHEMADRLGCKPQSFAYPYGLSDHRVARAVAERYARGCTTDLRGLASTDPPERLPRIDAWYLRDARRLRGWGSSRLGLYLGIRRLARRVRRAVS
jgi:peptidoglycan/xylan/chitin deacetylase (PgdA/CDA1 family)